MEQEGSDQSVFHEADLGENGGHVRFKRAAEIVDWASKERQFWEWLFENSVVDRRDVHYLKNIRNHINQLIVHSGALESDPGSVDARRRVFESLKLYEDGAILHSESRQAHIVSDVFNLYGFELAECSAGFLSDEKYVLDSTLKIKAAILSSILELNVSPESVSGVESMISEMKGRLFEVLDEKRSEYERNIDLAKSMQRSVEDSIRQNQERMLDSWLNVRGSVQQEARHAIDRINDTRRAYSEMMRLKAPVAYWSEKNIRHSSKSKSIRNISIVYAGVISAVMYFNLNEILNYIGSFKDQRFFILVGAIVATFTVVLWIGRILVKLMLSEHHLAIDAEERATMVETYLALIEEGKVAEGDRSVVLGALFRPSSDGVVREDSMPDTSVAALLSKLLERRP